MALPATHIRFAAAIADRFDESDEAAYYSGTLYPDSRWVSGIARDKTHAPRFVSPDFPSDDFTRGWHVHCVCDRIQAEIYDELLGDLSTMPVNARWVRLSAAKVVQDMHDAANAQLSQHLSMLTCRRTPNGESGVAVDAYLGFVRQAYGDGGMPEWRDYAKLWADVGLDRLQIGQIELQTGLMMADDALAGRLRRTFDRMLERWTTAFDPVPPK
jgi:hypothetical protein